MVFTEDTAPGAAAAERRTAIIRAAARCLADVGFDRVRLRDVAEASGASIGLIQYYFGTRDLLLQEAFDLMSEQLIARAGAGGAERDPWQRIVDLVESLAGEGDLRRHCVIWTQYCVIASREDALRRGVERIYAVWRRYVADAVRDGIAAGVFEPAFDADAVIDALITQVDGCELAVATGYNGMDAERLRELVLATAAALLGVAP